MLPRSYTVDSLSQSQDLADAILSSSTPSRISSTCASIESFLHSHTPDQYRHFFSIAFPALICKLFGFGDATSAPAAGAQSASCNGWIDAVLASNDPGLAARVFSLLSPKGTLMSSIAAVDRMYLVKYVFPTERLPEWVRFMLSTEKDCRVLSELCPLFKGKVEEDSAKGPSHQVHLNVFEYYMFWFAYYPICRGNNENLVTVSMKRSKKFRIENWTSSFRGLSGGTKRDPEQKLECNNLYIRLLYAYLDAFVPVFDFSVHQPYRSSLLHYGSEYDASVMKRAEFLVNTFVHYWLVDNDFSPVPVNLAKSFGVAVPFRHVLDETPPTSGLGEVVKLLVKYLNMSWVTSSDGENTVEHSGSPRHRALSSGSFGTMKSRDAVMASSFVRLVGSWNTYIQRPLYRFLLRTFLLCPSGSSIKNASEVFSVWVNYMEPWVISLDDFSELAAIDNGSAKDVRNREHESPASGYTYLWQGYVLSNYLYYSSLVMHFIGFAHKFLHTNPEVIVQMVLKVMDVLASSKELMDLLRNMDRVFHSKQTSSSKLTHNGLYRYVPSIREQLQDWENGLCESDADGSFLHENWNKDLRLFGDGEDGGQQLLQLFILRAEAELQAISGNNISRSLEYIDSLKAQVSRFFGGLAMKPILFSLEAEQHLKLHEDIFKPRNIGNKALTDVKYKGDWINRPISEDEVAWLAKLLIHLSCWFNEKLGLNRDESKESKPEVSCMEVSGDVGNVNGPKEAVKVILCVTVSWLAASSAAILRVMRRHGLRVNLRVLASKKFLMVLVVYAVFRMLKKAFGTVL